ncbi:deaminase domain-containing protein [Pseudomonas vanderleydeniana]|uniref:Deaminase n=1 Tax=Pseudomonas vanderleydeniana TaxID=2745495 RepID=A0A9E6PRN8_9PSED|nr:deaminase domain-containing protein [Pseudomonas vanderleydeniana]QXI31217.1 hypothetical protein HU752_015350 [Pseudomonas vanderleydeniana]
MPIHHNTGGAGSVPLLTVPGPPIDRVRCDVTLLGQSLAVAQNTPTYASILQGAPRPAPSRAHLGLQQAKLPTSPQPHERLASQLQGVKNVGAHQAPERPIPIRPAAFSGAMGTRGLSGLSTGFIERVAEIRKQYELYPNRNVAVARFTIDGKSSELIGISGARERAGTVSAPVIKIFDTVRTGDNSRELDSEYKILSAMAADMTASSKGAVALYSELRLCVSCDGVVEQFRQRFPDVVVDVTTGRPRQ